MKFYILILFNILICRQSFAKDTISITYGNSITNHMFSNEYTEKLENKVIDNSGQYVSNFRGEISFLNYEGDSYSKTTFLFGRDCIDSPIYGLGFSGGLNTSNNHKFGFVVGTYKLNPEAWLAREIPKYWQGDGFIPIIGIEAQLELIKVGNFKVDFHNYISPFIMNHSIQIGFEF